MNNYELAKEQARLYFLEKDRADLGKRTGVRVNGNNFLVTFLGAETEIRRDTGAVYSTLLGKTWEADFGETLSVYDWLCDRKPEARASGDFCPVSSLPGVYVSGSGLSMTGGPLPARIHRDPACFQRACAALGGTSVPLGDLGIRLQVFPDLPMLLKFYHADEDFPACLTLLWDRNTLDFVRYETVYYIAGTLFGRLLRLMDAEEGK